MTLEDDVTILDPFTHTKQDREKIMNFDFISGKSTTEEEKVMIDQTFCTLIAVGGKFLEKRAFQKVLKKIDSIRRIFRMKPLLSHKFFSINDQRLILTDSTVITLTKYHTEYS